MGQSSAGNGSVDSSGSATEVLDEFLDRTGFSVESKLALPYDAEKDGSCLQGISTARYLSGVADKVAGSPTEGGAMTHLGGIFIGVASLLSSSLYAATLTVDLNGGADYTEIQSAIDAAVDGDTVLVKPGEYLITEPINFKGKAIRVVSEAGAEVTRIRMSETPADPNRASVVVFENGEADTSMLSGLTLTGGMGTLSCLEGETCRVQGGGIFCRNGFPQMVECTIRGNAADEGGGIYYLGDASALSGIRHCTIAGNSAKWCGGGVYAVSPGVVGEEGLFPLIEDSAILGNSAPSGGAIFMAAESCLAINRCTIAGNLGQGGGGGGVSSIHFQDGEITVVVSDSIVWGNLNGSLDIADHKSVRVTHSCIEGRASIWPGEGNIDEDPLFCGWRGRASIHVDPRSPVAGDGSPEHPLRDLPSALEGYDFALSRGSPCIGASGTGAHMGAEVLGICDSPGGKARSIHLAAGTYEVAWLDLRRNVSLEGAGVEETTLLGTVFGLRTGSSLSHLTVTSGKEGGIVIEDGDSPEVRSVTVTENEGSSSGEYCGGIRVGGGTSPYFRECIISKNRADYGAGICCGVGSTPLFESCTIAGNRGHSGGGGIYGYGASLTMVNSTIAGNRGGGLGLTDCSAILQNCTLAENRASEHGAVRCNGTTPWHTRFINCLSWDNGENALCGEMLFCLPDQDPLFRRPGHWDDAGTPGNPDDDFWIPGDYRLQPGSPAIDAGTSEGAPTTDIEGHGRPCGAGVDIGAYEYGDCAPPTKFQRGDVDGRGGLDISDPIFLLAYLFLSGEALACLDAADINGDGTLGIGDAVYSLSYQFLGGPAPKSPFPECGIKDRINNLDCQSYPGCQ